MQCDKRVVETKSGDSIGAEVEQGYGPATRRANDIAMDWRAMETN
jgi:hypothetical protein